MATWRKPLTSNVRQPATVGYRAPPMKKVASLGLNISRDVPNLLEQIYTSKQGRKRVQKVETVLIHRVGESSSDSCAPLEYTASFEASHPAYTCLLPTSAETSDYQDLLPPSNVSKDSPSTSKPSTDNETVTEDGNKDEQDEEQRDVDAKDDAVGQDTVSDTGESMSSVSLDVVRNSEEDTTFPTSSISLSPDKYDPVGPEEIILHEKADALELERLADAFPTSTQKAGAGIQKSSEKSSEDVYALVSGEGKHVPGDITALPVKKTPSRRGPPPPRPPRSNSQKRVHFGTVATVGEEVPRDNWKGDRRQQSPGQAPDQQKPAGGLERSASNVSYIDITGIRKDSRPLIFV